MVSGLKHCTKHVYDIMMNRVVPSLVGWAAARAAGSLTGLWCLCVCVCVVGKVVKAEAAGAAGSCWCSGTMPEPPVALLHCFCIGHKLTPTPNTHPRYTHTLYTHTQARPAVPLSAVSTCICHAWQRWQWQSAIVALNLLHSPPPSAGDAATVWGNCWS